MDRKLAELISRCKYGVHLEINTHRDIFENIKGAIDEIQGMLVDRENPPLSPEVAAGMLKTKTIVNVHFYPRTPGCFYCVHHYDLDMALSEALECLE